MIVCIPSMNVPLQTKSDISWVSLALTLSSLMAMGLLMLWNVGTKAYSHFKRKFGKGKASEDMDDDSDLDSHSDYSASSPPNTGSEPTIVSGDGSELLVNPEIDYATSDQPAKEKRRTRRRRGEERQPEMAELGSNNNDILDGYARSAESEPDYGPNMAMIAADSAIYPTDYWRDYGGRAATPALTATEFGFGKAAGLVQNPTNVLSAYPSPQQPVMPQQQSPGGEQTSGRYAPMGSEHGEINVLDTQSGFGSPFLSPSERITGVKYAPSEAGVSRIEAIGAYDYGISPGELFISPAALGTDVYNNYAASSAGGGPVGSDIYGMYSGSNAGGSVPKSNALGPQSTSRAANIGRGALMLGVVHGQGQPTQTQSNAVG